LERPCGTCHLCRWSRRRQSVGVGIAFGTKVPPETPWLSEAVAYRDFCVARKGKAAVGCCSCRRKPRYNRCAMRARLTGQQLRARFRLAARCQPL
jgi:hypothetical protein